MKPVWQEIAKLIGEAMARRWIAECDRRTQDESPLSANSKKARKSKRSATAPATSCDGKAIAPTHE